MGSGYSTAGSASLTDRMNRAARLDSQLYDQVEHDLSATGQALTVVVIAAVANGIGAGLGEMTSGRPGGVLGGFVLGIIGALVGWAAWSFLAYFIGTRLFNGVATYGELLRTIGFAQSPGVLNILGIIPFIGGLIRFIVAVWILIATIIAMRQALDVETTKAVITAVIGFIVYVVLSVILGLLFIF